ncbi:MAG: gamma-butyrobetaine hydroxylase-like domain-containing protein [Candidatus Poribacteria bacterium]|nr:gamma-butyrobetaine hydroxylase-like domain-containing protein [Candidatus Poribacteria bacterium]
MNLSAQQYQPKTLKRLGDTGFLVEWKDGHRSEYPFPYLRRMCPCAECSAIRHKGLDVHSLFAPDGDGDYSLIQVSGDVLPLDIQLVGRYAVQFRWSDGHSTGIYSFQTLKEMCPCAECNAHIDTNEGDPTMSRPEFQPDKHEISPCDLKDKLDSGDQIALLDVREPDEYDIVHLEGATLIPLNDLPQNADQLDRQTEIVTYCHHGMRSLHAAAFLYQNGFDNVKSLAGGIDQWAVEIDPALARY